MLKDIKNVCSVILKLRIGFFSLILLLITWMNLSCEPISVNFIDHAQGEIAGEVSQSSVILQSRLTQGSELIDGDINGTAGMGCFEISESFDFSDSFQTQWINAHADYDYIIKTKVKDLKPATRYYYRLVYGSDVQEIKKGRICTFRTLAGADVEDEVSFAVVTGMNYHRFHHGSSTREAYKGPDKHLGYPALKTMLDMKPDFFVGTGDNVYYDRPKETPARTQVQLRKKWHEQFVQQRYIDLFAQVPTYWQKDDHDHRYNDCDTTGDKEPSSELGIKTFLEQVPVVDPAKSNPITYRDLGQLEADRTRAMLEQERWYCVRVRQGRDRHNYLMAGANFDRLVELGAVVGA